MTEDILFRRQGTAGIVTLNRPAALNALTHGMVRALDAQLVAWESDPSVTRVVLTAEGERAFCAGGDIRALYDLGRAGRQNEALEFFRDEYRLNIRIKHYRKPYIALIDGIVMGGGVGISVHGSHRVAGDRYAFAMPEVGIGFFPDVGGTYALSRLPDHIGTFCALTGERLKTADAVTAGIATHHVPTRRLAELADGLTGAVSPDAVIAAFSEPAGDVIQLSHRAAIARAFAGATVEDILHALDANEDAALAGKAANTIRTKSPTSLKIALEQMRRGADANFDECMAMEFRIVSRILHGHDFYEGVRALIVDKDNTPRWNPASLDSVSDAAIDAYFAPLGDTELTA